MNTKVSATIVMVARALSMTTLSMTACGESGNTGAAADASKKVTADADAGDGGDASGLCERVRAAQIRFFAGKTDCGSLDDVNVRRAERPSATCNVSKCTSSDKTRIEAYALCVDEAPACAGGAEKAATAAYLDCLRPLIADVSDGVANSKLSPDCGAEFNL